jgi:short-subunit dehydrogenase
LTSLNPLDYKQPMEFSGKVVVVTGASMGIGEALAQAFASRGANVVMSSRDASRVESARQRIGYADRTIAVSCDIRNREEIDKVVSLTLHHFGRIDVWINNAGYGLSDSVTLMDMAECRALFETNLFGAIAGMQAVVPVMKQQRSGTIINISSVAGHIPLPYSGAYSATKFALNAIGKAARVELKGSGVNVLTVCPGYVRTEFAGNRVRGRDTVELSSPRQGGITAQRVAEATVLGYQKNKREVVVPGSNRLFIWVYRVWPGIVERVMARMARPRKSSAPAATIAPR